jgi:hypothetical protein
MESRSISLVLFAVTIASLSSGQDGKQSQSVILPIAARPVVSAALGHDIQRYGVRNRDGVLWTDNGQNLCMQPWTSVPFFSNRDALRPPMSSADAQCLLLVLVLPPAFVRALQCFRVQCFEPFPSLRLGCRWSLAACNAIAIEFGTKEEMHAAMDQ